MSKDDLYAIAAAQRGYFRTGQALECGWTRRNLSTATAKGQIETVSYGLYRFAHFPATDRDDLYEIGTLEPRGSFTHETALTLYGLTDLIPRTTHFTIPPDAGFRPRPGITIHHSRITDDDRRLRDGLWITSPARTLLDGARSGLDPEQLLGAAHDARDRGLLTDEDLARIHSHYPYNLIVEAQ